MRSSRNIILGLLALAAGLWISCDEESKKIPDPLPPSAPTLLAILDSAQTEVEMNWSDESVDETGFRIERKVDGGDWITDGQVNRNVTDYTSTGLVPATHYTYRVWSFNEAGDSETPSNEKSVTTVSNELAPKPTSVSATAIGPTLVLVSWTDPGDVDSFRVQRGQEGSSWTDIVSLPDGVESYEDAGVVEGTAYFYRVGSVNEAGINWSTTIAEVTTPDEGAPNPPSNLSGEVDLTFGVTLTWEDNATNETGFQISRNTSGQVFQNIDTVEANTTTYVDSLAGQQGVFGYRIRAFNELGNSAWSNVINLDFTYHSAGTIPLYISGLTRWLYDVNDIEHDLQYQTQRIVRGVEFIEGVDHYGVIETTWPIESTVDTLYYLRNIHNSGCYGVLPPLSGSSTSELLFQYPAGDPGTNYDFHGDSMVVIIRNHIITIGDSTYTGVIGYQRFYHNSDRTIKYYIVPNRIGIIKEEEFLNSTLTLVRTMFDYKVNE